jgi:hypothetical protein
MAFQISIHKDDRHLFATETFFFRQIDQLQHAFGWLNVKFPENKGFELKIHRFPRCMPAISREDFRKCCLANDWRALLDLFILEEELDAFRSTKRLLDLDDYEQDTENDPESDTLKAMYGYQNDMVILQYGQEQPRFIVPGDTLFEATDLAIAERECYRLFLRITDRAALNED